MSKILATNTGKTWLPEEFLPGHELCFLLHDYMTETFRSGWEDEAFVRRIDLNSSSDKNSFTNTEELFNWLEETGQQSERNAVLRTVVFPMILSDFLHFIYESLQCARKAKMAVAFTLIRKPIQENLFILESIASDPESFGNRLTENPLQLRAQKAGGIDVHAKRIAATLAVINESDRFDAEYIARLRYDKNVEDSFDGICNLALHLFTSHESIKTEPMNVNFIFSNYESWLTQWNFYYSRLPVLLLYTFRIVEHLFSEYRTTDPVYVEEMERRLYAAFVFWYRGIDDGYRCPQIEMALATTRERLEKMCTKRGYRKPTVQDLDEMRTSGSWPGESKLSVKARRLRYDVFVKLRKLQRR